MNDKGFNRFHKWMGSYLDDYIGNLPKESVLHEVQTEVNESLRLYYESIINELEQRGEERGSLGYAMAVADPSSIIVRQPKCTVEKNGTKITVHITFMTLLNEEGSLSLNLGVM